MYTLNIARAIKKMSANEIRALIFGNYYKQIGFSKANIHYSMKRLKKKDLLFLENKFIEKITNLRNAKEHFQTLIRKKTRKSVKQSQIITYQTKKPFKIQTLLI